MGSEMCIRDRVNMIGLCPCKHSVWQVLVLLSVRCEDHRDALPGVHQHITDIHMVGHSLLRPPIKPLMHVARNIRQVSYTPDGTLRNTLRA